MSFSQFRIQGGANGEINVSFDDVCYGLNPPNEQKFKVRAVYQACSGNDITVLDTIYVSKPVYVPPPNADSAFFYCVNDSASPIVASTTTSGYTLKWYDENELEISVPTPSTSVVGVTTYYVTQSSAECESDKFPIQIHIQEGTVEDDILAICKSELPFTKHGITWDSLTAAGVYSDTVSVKSLGGCDSVIYVSLTIHPEYEIVLDTAICVSELPVTIHNNTWVVSTDPGDYTHTETYSGVGGCDSTHIVNLTIHPEYELALDTAICVSELPVTIHNKTWVVSTDPGNYTHTEIYSGIGGCDSTYHVNLMINDYITDTLEATICEGEDFVFNGITYTSAVTLQDNITDTFATSTCDSIVTLILNVNPVEFTTITESICPGFTFPFGGQDLSVAGTYYDTLQTTLGCDSIITLVLGIDDFLSGTLEVTICEGEDFVFNGITYTSVVTLQDNVTDTIATSTCDSIVTLILNVNPVEATTINESICINETFPFGGQDLSVAGTYYDTLQTSSGCDSIITLVLGIEDFLTSTLEESICAGESFVFNGITYTSGVTLQDNITDTFSTAGCDSIVTLILNVNPVGATTIIESVCAGTTFSFGGQDLSAAGTYFDTLQTALGCDSIITLNLTVDPYITNTIEATICEGESYVFNGIPYTSAVSLLDNVTDTFATLGCDSIVTLVLNVNPTITTTLNESICPGFTFSFGGQDLSVAGTYYDTLQTSSGCDSIITLVLGIDDFLSGTLEATICEGEDFVFNGITYTSAVTLQDNVTDTIATSTCDSIVTLILNVNPVGATTIIESVCAGTTFSFGGQDLSVAGTYYDTLQTTLGCDSIITLVLGIDDFLSGTLEATICEGEDFVFNGITYTSGVTLQDNVTDTIATSTCDSIVTLVLNFNPVQSSTINELICPGTTFSFGGQDLSTGGTYFDTLQTYLGCDSIITLILDINDYITDTLEATICEGEDFVFNGITYTSGVTLQDNITDTFATAGCDSIVTLVLNFYPVQSTTINESICPGTTFSFGGQDLSTGGTYFDTLQTYLGCDSIITLILDIDDYITSTLEETLCEGESFVFNGITYTSEVTLQDNITDTFATAGCDSIVTLVLNVNPVYHETEELTLCESALPYVWNGINIPIGPVSQNNFDSITYTTVEGCDSVISLNLVINDTFQFHETMTVCSSDLPITWHQYTFDSQLGVGSYTESATYQTLEGCDSAYFLTLNVKQSYQLSQDTTICKDSFPFTWHGYVFTNEEATVLSPQIPYVASNNCDSIISLNVNVFPTPEHLYIYEEGCESIVFEGNIYNQSVTFVDTIFAQSGCDSLIRNIDISVLPTYYEKLVLDFSGCDSVVFQGQTYYSNTQIIDTFFTIHGCDSLVKETNININHFDLQLNASLDTVYRGEVVHLETNASSAYSVLSWTPVSLFPYQNATSQYLALDNHVNVEVVAEGVNGCSDTASLYLYLKELDKRVFVPNAFSPNDDGLNDEFGPEIPVNRGYMIENFSVYNRYGERVFFSSGQLNKKWNGTLRGAPADMGVYFYVLVVRFLDGDRFEAKGEVNLIR